MTENRATYSPEDNKLRLYVGRVPRDEYLKLRAEGWVALHKQREAGGGDFAATWTPERRNTALEYADIIEDEDMGPEERAADRAERFSGYRDKRSDEAVGHADNYDAGPSAHGFQSAAKAERAAQKHDRMATRACDSWDKAEYWQRRTEGVIRHALHKSSPGVRMGRIKTIEAELRKHNAAHEKWMRTWKTWQKIAAITDPQEQTKAAVAYSGASSCWDNYKHPRPETCREYYRDHDTSLYSLLTDERDPITGAEACALFFAKHPNEPQPDNAWSLHYKLRLAYENQMLAAQGGMLEQCEVQVGGKLGGHLIIKVNKSSATGRATSVSILGERVQGWAYKSHNIPGTEWGEHQIDLERIKPGAYTPPTPESLKELEEFKQKVKSAKPAKDPCPLINPTDEDAEKLQAIWNARGKERFEAQSDAKYLRPFKPSTICRITQAVYSQASKGSYARAETRDICRNAEPANDPSNMWSREREERAKRIGSPVCKVRITSSDSDQWPYVKRVIILTDKPQKPLPDSVWPVEVEQPVSPAAEQSELIPA